MDSGTSTPVQVEYVPGETLHQDGCTTVIRALRSTDRRPVVLKVVDPRRCRARDLQRLRRYYEIARSLNVSAVVRPIAFESYQGMPALVLEDFGGESLDRHLGRPMPIGRFLDLSIRIAGALSELHQQGFIHKDLKPENIFVHPETGEVKLGDLGIAARLPGEQQAAWPPALIEGSLPYMSPEQTGRMNRALDSRSDHYSLGVTFYQMLTGRLPFAARDPLEWVHCHVARPPVPPRQLVPEIPEALDRIVMRLLAKMPEDRYQTANGLEHDLARCLEQWRGSGRIEPFILGDRDVPGHLQIPQKLYGREEQVAALIRAFERVAETGAAELVLVSGYAGIGKTSVVRELEQPILGRRGLFAQGKFDQYKRDIPYSTIVQACGELVSNLLAEGEERVVAWRERLQAALGANGQLVVGMIPEVELLVGKQPPVPELQPAEAKNRFRMVFRRFIGAFAREEHPLTLFMDDLQWVDPASLVLLQDLISDPEMRWLLLIGAYRDNEVAPAHPLALALVEARKAGARITEIVLGALSDEALTAFVADTLRSPPREAAPLADLIREKTAANPFFAIQFLTALHQDNLLNLDENTGRWRWDIGGIRIRRFTDNVTELMLQKLKRLPPATQEALAQLACLGSEIEGSTAGWILGRSEEQARTDLWTALCEGLIVQRGDAYQFAHDRVQEAAYALVPEQLRPAAHLRAGRILLSHLSGDAIVQHVFPVVDQLNRGVALIDDASERDETRRLNVLAGRRARDAIAYASARNYLTRAAELLPQDSWQARYEETFDLELERAECEYLTGNVEVAEELSARILAKSRSDIDRARVHKLRIRMTEAAGRNREAMEAVHDALLPFGMIVPESDEEIQAAIEAEEREVETQLRGRAIADLADAPTVSDPKVQAIMSLIAVSLSPAYMAQRQHFPLLAAMGVNACLRQGNTAESSSVYNSYALVRAGAGDFGSALQFSDVALRLLAKSNDPVTRGVLLFRHGFFINHWRNHVATSLPYLQESFSASMAAGNLLYAGYARFAAVETSIEKGDPLDEVLRVSREYAEFAKGTRNDATCDTLRVQQRFVACLKGWTRELACSDDRALADQAQLSGFAVWRYHVLKQMVSFLFGRYDEALESAEQAAEALRGVVALLLVGTHHFYRALVLAAVYPGTDATRREGLKRELAEELRIHREWADNCPDNFANRYALVSAEVARIEGREVDAERLYEQAIRSARDNDFVQNEALAYELASNFYRARGYAEVADLYLRDARDCYERWGADGKVKQLEGLYPHLIELRPPGRTPTFTARPEQLDLLAVVKASQTISGEIEVERLLGTLLQVVLEQGGARRGCLVLERDGALFVEAEASIEEKGMVTRILPSLEMDSSLLLPVSVVQHSRVTRQPVILEDAAADPGKFASDVYFSRHRTRSVLCLPILRQAELVGLVYLENRYIAGAFTPDRLTTLSLLASQAAISLESARFVHEERQTRQRLTVLAEAGALLSESLDYHQTLKRLCRLCVESLADWCVLDLLDGREVHRLAGACADPAKELFLEQLRQRHPARWDSPHPAAQCLRSGNAILLPEITDEAQKDLCEDEDHLKLILALPTRSVMAVPLITRGQTLGVLTMASATPRRYGKADLELAQELTQRAASAIELERELKERKKIQEELLERVEMAALTADVGMAMTKGDTLQATLQRCAEAIVSHLGAAFARIWIHGPEQGVLVLQASAGRYTRIQGTCGRVRIGEFKIGKIAEERRAHLTNDISSDVLIDQEWARREGLVSFAGHPLLTGGKLVGVMAMFADRPLGEVALKALAAIADAVAVAIQRGLAETARASLEEQFRQAQKLESVGRLAGGIAHDFNNLLTVILAGAEMLKQDLGGGSSPAFPMVEEIASAGMRARDLTRQLLAFARRQVISPVPLDLNVLVRNEEKLLHRVLGEDVELVTKLEPSLWSVRCDPGQIEQVILNLAVNSRDAMPKGGTLEIETSNFEVDARDPPLFSGVEPGPFVRLAIRDSGVGMSQEVKSHLFEPFFTTKPAGKGTGLGLATVYGIVEQSAGFIRVDSEPGRGTTFEVLFPRTSDVAIAGAAPVPRASAKGHESILVVEDDPEVRAVTVRSLRAGGYEVLAAGAAQQALDIVNRESKRFHLLVTDVVMPGQDGRSLAEELRRLHPTMRVLYVSGHPEEVIAKRGVLDAGIELLLKPFTPSSLLARVREVLDAR